MDILYSLININLCLFLVSFCVVTMHSISIESSKNTTLSTQEELSNVTSAYIPPIYVNSSHNFRNLTPIMEPTAKDLHEKLGKMDYTRTTNKMPVIEENTKVDSFNSSNQTTITTFNQTENITFTKDEFFNQSSYHNFEQIKKDGDVPVISAAGIVGITLGCVTIIASIIFISFVVYRNRGLNRPQVLNDHCSNLDSSGYIDDASIRVCSTQFYI